MANNWLRLWHELPNDPKFRTVSRESGQSISEVIAVYIHMLVCASTAIERGSLDNWQDEDAASALDMKNEQITAIKQAMENRLIKDNKLSGWDVRQPLREDNSAQRSKEWRERKKEKTNATERKRTQPNATERKRTLDKDKDKDKDKKEKQEKEKSDIDSEMKFENFWNHYRPIKTSKGSKQKAQQIFNQLIKKGEDYDEIMQGLDQYMRHCHQGGQYTKSVTTWLSSESWKESYADIAPVSKHNGLLNAYSQALVELG